MTSEHALEALFLQHLQARQPPPANLGPEASAFLDNLSSDPRWVDVRWVLGELASGNVHRIMIRQDEAMREISDFGRTSRLETIGGGRPVRKAEPSLTQELVAAEADLRASTGQLAQAAEAAEKIKDDSPLAQAAARIAGSARGTIANLPPYWLLIVLWWLFLGYDRPLAPPRAGAPRGGPGCPF